MNFVYKRVPLISLFGILALSVKQSADLIELFMPFICVVVVIVLLRVRLYVRLFDVDDEFVDLLRLCISLFDLPGLVVDGIEVDVDGIEADVDGIDVDHAHATVVLGPSSTCLSKAFLNLTPPNKSEVVLDTATQRDLVVYICTHWLSEFYSRSIFSWYFNYFASQ